MRINDRLLTIASNVVILIGIALGIFGAVRVASLFIAVGTAGMAIRPGTNVNSTFISHFLSQ